MNARQSQLDGAGALVLVACCVFWGFQQVLVKATLAEVAPVFQAALRFAGATLLLAIWSRLRGVPLRGDAGMRRAGMLAGALFAAEFACLYVGLLHTSASRLTLFLYTSPFWVAALLPLRIRSERLGALQWAGLICAFVGLLVALGDHAGTAVRGDGLPWLGDLLAIAAGMFWGLTTVVIRSTALTRASPEQLLFYQVGFSGLTLPLVSLALGEQWTLALSGFALTSLLLQTVVGAFASYLVWMWMLGRYPATQLSVFVFLTPIFALLFGAAWLHEAITPGLIAALVLVVAGIHLVNRRRPRPSTSA